MEGQRRGVRPFISELRMAKINTAHGSRLEVETRSDVQRLYIGVSLKSSSFAEYISSN